MYFVIKEHTLVVRTNHSNFYDVLHASILKGATFQVHPEPIYLPTVKPKDIREATLEDFDTFRVSPFGFRKDILKKRLYGEIKVDPTKAKSFYAVRSSEDKEYLRNIYVPTILYGSTEEVVKNKIERQKERYDKWIKKAANDSHISILLHF